MQSNSRDRFSKNELVIYVSPSVDSSYDIHFFKVPKRVLRKIGDIQIDWGEGEVQLVDNQLNEKDIKNLRENKDFEALACITHRYLDNSDHVIRIFSKSGFLPLAHLPLDTEKILSPLPTLTLGQMTAEGEIVASSVLPNFFSRKDDSLSPLKEIPADYFFYNEGITYLDYAFAKTSLEELPTLLFDPLTRLSSLRGTFAGSLVKTIPQGLFEKATADTIMMETFADCTNISELANPFAGTFPLVCNDMFRGVSHWEFDWAPRYKREELGWIAPDATDEDTAFEFIWEVKKAGQPEVPVRFYPIDLPCPGNFFIEWGDDKTELVDWNTCDELTHTWQSEGEFKISLHWGHNVLVRPFQLGSQTLEILSPLPEFQAREVAKEGDFVGWAVNLRKLRAIPRNLFDLNPSIESLEEAFAGCLKLKNVPDDLLACFDEHLRVSGMFAFCKSLSRLPTSYTARTRQQEIDFFVDQTKD